MAFSWDQFQPYEQGGITGQPNVDPSQLQGSAPNVPGTPGWNGGYAGGLTPPTMAQQQTNNPNAQPPSTPAPPTGGTQDPKAYFDSLFPGPSLSPQDLLAHEAELKAHGITLIKNAAGLPGKVQLADGSAFDVIRGAGAGQNQKAWDPIVGPSGSTGTLSGIGAGSFVTPMSEFAPPSYVDALNDPGAQYAISEAQRGMENSAAAKGTLLNGRTLQAENAATMANANTLYGDIYGRAANTFGINYGVRTGNQDRPFSKYLSLAQLGQQATSAS